MTAQWIVSSCVLILVVLLLRILLGRHISARLQYALWAVVLIRLLAPPAWLSLTVTVPKPPAWAPPESMREESIYLLPLQSAPVEGMEHDVLLSESGEILDANSFGYARLENGGRTVTRYADRISPLQLLRLIWGAGAVILGTLLLLSNLGFARRLHRSRRRLEDTAAPLPVYRSAGLPSPCLFGLLRPAVYVTEEAAQDPVMLRHVLAHELTHYRHRDHLWSVLRGAALAIHWWNPLVWLAARLSQRDGELACDEGALKRLGDGERAAYGKTLLALVTGKAAPGGPLLCSTAMTGDKKSLKERFARIARAPKRAVGIAATAVVLALLVTVCAFGQKTAEESAPWEELSADLSLTIDEDGIVHITGTVDGMELPTGTTWWADQETLFMSYPPFTDGIEGLIWASWADGSREVVTINTGMMASLSSYFPSGHWIFDVDLSGERPKVTRMEAVAGTVPDGAEVLMHPKTISDEDAVRAGRIAARLLTAAEEFYRDWEEKGSAAPKETDTPAVSDTPQENEPLRYSGVTRVTGEFEYPPFETFTLTGREANELLDCLSALELSDYETTGGPEGDGVTYTVETQAGSYSFVALKPYFLYDGSAYLLGMDSELFQVTDRIAAGHGGAAEPVSDTPTPLEPPETSESPAPSENPPEGSSTPVPPPAQELSEMTQLPYHPDLNRNGVPETLLVGEYHRWDDPSGESTLEGVGVWEDGELLWTSTETDSPGSGNAYLLVDLDNGDYLMVYSVWSENGRYASTYLGYDLKPLGQQSFFNGDTHFICSSGEEVAQTFSAEDTADFLDNINRLLSRSTVILDREGVFANRDAPHISLSWLENFAAGFTWDDRASSLENLTRFKELSLNPPQSAPVTDSAGARAALRAAMLGETDFTLWGSQGRSATVDIDTAPPRAFESLSAEWEKYNSFAVVDLDGDGVEEVVYHVTDVAGDMGGHLILRWAGPGDLRCYSIRYSHLMDLKADGSFWYSMMAGMGGMGGTVRLSFPAPGYVASMQYLTEFNAAFTPETPYKVNGEIVSEEEYDAAQAKQDEKPDAVWYDFTPENVRKALG